jgi:hypothetical protein
MPNQTTQRPKFNPEIKTLLSLFFGIISILGEAITFTSFISFRFPPFWKNIVFQSEIIGWIAIIVLFLGWLFPLLGIILGITGLKSQKKKLAIIGILLSLIGLIGYIYICLIALRIGTA